MLKNVMLFIHTNVATVVSNLDLNV